MMRALGRLIRVSAGVLLVLGIAIAGGTGPRMRAVHVAIGVVFVGLLIVLSVRVLVSGQAKGWPWLLIVWAVVIASYGIAHARLLPGSAHWLAQLTHVVVGLAGVGIAERISKARTETGLAS